MQLRRPSVRPGVRASAACMHISQHQRLAVAYLFLIAGACPAIFSLHNSRRPRCSFKVGIALRAEAIHSADQLSDGRTVGLGRTRSVGAPLFATRCSGKLARRGLALQHRNRSAIAIEQQRGGGGIRKGAACLVRARPRPVGLPSSRPPTRALAPPVSAAQAGSTDGTQEYIRSALLRLPDMAP